MGRGAVEIHTVLRMKGLKKALTFFKLLYLQKFISEMSSTRPFYPILIPNTSYVKKKYFTWYKGVPEIFQKLMIAKTISGKGLKEDF